MCEDLEYEICDSFPISVGDTLPNITFEVFYPGEKEEIKEISTKELLGKWVIFFFYPADFTFVCPTELEDMAHLYEDFKNEGAEVISVSTDTVFTHKAWHDSSEAIEKIKYPMASDSNHQLSELFGVLEKEKGVALRGTFIIDPNGVVRMIEINDNSIGRNAKEVLRKIRAIKFVTEHDGKVCPANWEPGEDTLEPNLNMVGKI